ncbi:TetR/AcrR family transcriptional regulator [Marinomonas mediterranea]|jgi:transcriptional regulator|uniref:Regulatory protein TetR n=1 Tax=Marinomonas mediterranea (strain ATCC 700492 / JCM 21426 / NBRC 103028 / MMB-1) TaxID=717774 RepID=F2JXL4_MARM1|nr:TetR/AcrR family transcriptional regulator [Marinomonas mediterranea]ADZ93012.1 regulatory protein TetR [Marinomonas mediterranea MMB-1]WCN10923.1 TetR family transcriptional regulator [Marinomonas mediterranea]WCN14985.1 TetR family transcriptional regulator [Marinomonas mediterranea]WCN19029.1 TetR family transcriptional regulator [Marinomonas mediterranea MMB-1]
MSQLPSQQKPLQEVAKRSRPVQSRSIKRTQQILDITGELLEHVGVNDLTTAMIAKELGISVGSLYHYFPNKQAILFSMGEVWLESIEAVLESMNTWAIEDMSLDEFIEKAIDLNLHTYRSQKAILVLVQAMFSIPELKELDERHDNLVIRYMADFFQRLGFKQPEDERGRIARLYLEVTHASYLVIVNQNNQRAARTLVDLKRMISGLLLSHKKSQPI